PHPDLTGVHVRRGEVLNGDDVWGSVGAADSGAHYSASGAISAVVIRRLGQLGRRAHALDDDRPERLQLLVVAGPLEAALEDDGQLPLGEDDVVVDVVDLTARHLGVVGDNLVAGRHAQHVDVARLGRLRRAGVVGPAL